MSGMSAGQCGEHMQQPAASKPAWHFGHHRAPLSLRVVMFAFALIPDDIAGSSPVGLGLEAVGPGIAEPGGTGLPTDRTVSVTAAQFARRAASAHMPEGASWHPFSERAVS
jgi:hypothetical protein